MNTKTVPLTPVDGMFSLECGGLHHHACVRSCECPCHTPDAAMRAPDRHATVVGARIGVADESSAAGMVPGESPATASTEAHETPSRRPVPHTCGAAESATPHAKRPAGEGGPLRDIHKDITHNQEATQ